MSINPGTFIYKVSFAVNLDVFIFNYFLSFKLLLLSLLFYVELKLTEIEPLFS